MSDFLSAVSTVALRSRPGNQSDANLSISEARNKPHKKEALVKAISPSHISSPEDALQILKSQPDETEIQDVLRYLLENSCPDFDVRFPGSKASGLLRHLITTTLPTFWHASEDIRNLLTRCMRSVPGLSGMLAELRITTNQREASKQVEGIQNATSNAEHLDVLQRLLGEDDLVWVIWRQLSTIQNETQKRLLWREFMALLSSGKVVSTVAHFEDIRRRTTKTLIKDSWLAQGKTYTVRIAAQIASFLTHLDCHDDAAWTAAAELFTRCGGMGYADGFMREITMKILHQGQEGLITLQALVDKLRASEQKRYLRNMLGSLNKIFVSGDQNTIIQATSAFLGSIVSKSDSLTQELEAWLSDPKACCTTNQSSRRAAVATLGGKMEHLQQVFEQSTKIFGETMFVQHAPAVQQEACAEVVLLAAGQLNRREPATFRFLARSSAYSQMVSNRLNASSERARILGMCVGMAISALLDQPDKQLKFNIPEVKTTWATTLRALTGVEDLQGTIDDIQIALGAKTEVPRHTSTSKPKMTEARSSAKARPKMANQPQKQASQTQMIGPRIVEVLGDDEEQADDHDGLKPYPKPDSDPEDSDDDPTLVNRDKPKAPVYIRDLIAGLQDQENYDRHKLALENAASLIRRKAKFGKEVSDHATELGLILIGLQDQFDLDHFVELRLQALIALLISNPSDLAPWLAKQAFEGDYSLSQRGTILSAIGLAARELAGYTDTDALNPTITSPNSFPSKRLPEKYHAIYAPSPSPSTQPLPSSPLNTITSSLTTSILSPLTATLADAATGPSVLKTRTISSRLSPSIRTHKIPNSLSTLLYTSFFTPLLGHFHTHTSLPSSRARNIYLQPHFLGTYLKTLGLLVHASGPGTVSLPALTGEFWSLLLGLRGKAMEDPVVMEAVLFGFLAVLEVNEDTRRVAVECGREVVETREWVGMVFERMNAGGRGEEERVRGLAAGVVIKCGEVMERWERLMVGEMMDY
ncbi:telomere length regulation protein-domain-containing protein [Elsinoe ampelina]|uniref:Telomere length regulation protein-domain-containing protein n=1 Tax=Elsinoe ampelina TaxID=302913 RepID=A0A6A6GH51_9PEZI|nr:telomere length regulation protein-domain-containing protein [Elsinoe ampelina]